METTAALSSRLAPAAETPINVFAQLERLDAALARLHGLIGDTEARLEGVLTPAPPQADPMAVASPGFCSPLTERIHNAVTITNAAFERLEAITSRIDL